MLSDDAKLRKKIIDVARNERNGLLIILVGVFLVGAGLIFCAIGKSGLSYFGGVSISALGIFSTLFGFYVSVHYARKYNDLLKEIKHTL